MSHTHLLDSSHSAASQPAAPTKVDWPRAFRAINLMRVDPERTDQVFELATALDGGDSERNFQLFLNEPDGPALLEERPVLLDRLADFDTLRGFHPDSLGANYQRVMQAAGFDADGLRREAAKIEEFAELHPGVERTWFAERFGCIHDLLHVVSGYGHDTAGETALLAFTDGMYGRRARLRVIRFGLFASIISAPRGSVLSALIFSIRARRRGSRTWIPFTYRWEDALARPLADVRNELSIAPVTQTHPAGILIGGPAARWSYGPAIC